MDNFIFELMEIYNDVMEDLLLCDMDILSFD